MYKFNVIDYPKTYLIEELIRVCLSKDEYEIVSSNAPIEGFVNFNMARSQDRDQIKREVYDFLSGERGKTYPWGILTGIRPIKLAGECYEGVFKDNHNITQDDALQISKEFLKSKYLISDEKLDYALDMYQRQVSKIGRARHNSLSLYIGIPFCPTRCSYCSFPSNQGCEKDYNTYVDALIKEVEFCGQQIRENGQEIESIYIGGGTPTSLSANQLDRLFESIGKSLTLDYLREFTCECGRADTITDDRLDVIKSFGINRISINPQSLKEETLAEIGRSHSVDDFYRAFELAREKGFDNINCDLICGLPGENLEDFERTLEGIMKLGPEDVTIHTLAIKRASKLVVQDKDFFHKREEITKNMVKYSHKVLLKAGYEPYYLYRQKHMAGALENTGYCMDGKYGIYNVRIMDEHQSILALGAGGISKRYYPDENRLERIPNVTNYSIYIERIEDMIERKAREFWR